ncbi:GatB/YqeY domain-containing protein [Pseudonocardia phyllosphaerae]|uniref:GatB/YqeY domain-containing protein n=1 Tax=Pseudonocardia phyllosphaerae TaxID=3390502 RepID=UPI00397E1938
MLTTMRADLTTALKARDRVTAAALRSALAAFDNASAVEAAPAAGSGEHVAGAATGVGAAEAERRSLSRDDLDAVLDEEIRERSAAAEVYAQAGRAADAERLRAEAAVLARYRSDA